MINSIIEEYMKNNPGQKLTKKELNGILKAFENALLLKMGEEVQNATKDTPKVKVFTLGPVGSFLISYRSPRKLNLPSKSGSTMAPEAWVASFKPSKALKDSLKAATATKQKK